MSNSLFPQRPTRRALAVLVLHAVVFVAVYWLAFGIRTDFAISESDWVLLWLTMPGVVLLKLMIFYYAGHCHRSWYSVSFSDLIALFHSATLSLLIVLAFDALFVNSTIHLPKGVLLVDWGLTILVLGGLRAIGRMSREELSPRLWRSGYRKALIVGANQSGETLARHLLSDRRLKYQPVGYLDEDPARIGSTVGGIPVWGEPTQALPIASRLGVEDILVISGVLAGPQLRRLMEGCAGEHITLKVIPAYDDLLAGGYSPQMRDVDINDLLRREPVQLNSDAISSLLAGRSVMVTGAGGSIGSEICRQVLKFRPKTLLLVEQAENSLFLIEQEFRALRTETHVVPCIADITDGDADDPNLPDAPPVDRVSRGRAQARADDGVQPGRGDQEQRAGNAAIGRAGRRQRRPRIRHDLDRQGRQSDEHHGRVEAIGRAFRARVFRSRPARSSSWSASATCWPPTAAWCRSSRSRFAAAARSPSRIPRSSGSS